MAIITEAFKDTYRRNFEPLVQQRVSKLLSGVDVQTGIEKIAGERHYIDQIGTREPTQVTTRHPDSPQNEQDFLRRAMTMTDWHDGLIIDKTDVFRTLDNPANSVTTAMRRGFARQIDRIIRDAATGDSFSGHTGGTTETLQPANKVAVDYVESGNAANSNLTIGKLRRTLEILEGFDVDTDDLHFAAHPSQKHALLTDDEITSVDFNSVKALVNGEINTFLGFTFHWLTILSKSGNNRTCFGWDRNGIVCGFAKQPTVEMDPARSDKSFHPYLYTAMTIGSIRIEEERVVEVLCDES